MFLKDSSADKSEKSLPMSLGKKEVLSALQFFEVILGNFLSPAVSNSQRSLSGITFVFCHLKAV